MFPTNSINCSLNINPGMSCFFWFNSFVTYSILQIVRVVPNFNLGYFNLEAKVCDTLDLLR